MTEQPETEAEVAESYGLDVDSFDTVQRRMWDDQQAFLGNYAKAGTVLNAARAAHVSRQTVYNWQNSRALAFKERFKAAKEAFRESLEDIMFQRLRDPKTHPVLLIFALKAHWPEKYRDDATPPDNSARDVLDAITERARQRMHNNERPVLRVATST